MKKIYIKEDKLKLLKESYWFSDSNYYNENYNEDENFINTPDTVRCNDNALRYYDYDAFAFIVYTDLDSEISIEIAKKYGLTHREVYDELFAKLLGFKSNNEFMKFKMDNKTEYLKNYSSKLTEYSQYIMSNPIYEGRIWVENNVISFWDETPNIDLLNKILYKINERFKIDINNIKIAIGTEIINIKNWKYTNNVDNDDFKYDDAISDKELKAIHLMNQQDKKNALRDFIINRGEIQGKKLGKMPMAQYHNLIYQEEKDVFNWGNYFSNLKRIDESIRNKVKK